MNIYHYFAQVSDYGYSTSLTPEESAAAFALILFLGVFVLFFAAALYVFIAICLQQIFKKAGVENTWAAWVPFYSHWKLLEIGGQPGYWAVLALIPLVGIASVVLTFIAQHRIGKSFGKGGEFVLFAIFLPYVWFPWLAFDKSTWHGAPATASK